MKYMCTSLVGTILLLTAAQSWAFVTPAQHHPEYNYNHSTAGIYLLAENEVRGNERVESGTLVLPAAAEEEKKEKKCMTVCGRWGEECMFINRGAGGMTKKCRRACKKFVEECF